MSDRIGKKLDFGELSSLRFKKVVLTNGFESKLRESYSKIVAQIEFLEWTDGERLRHTKFVGLRGDKYARGVVKEHLG